MDYHFLCDNTAFNRVVELAKSEAAKTFSANGVAYTGKPPRQELILNLRESARKIESLANRLK